MASVAFSGPVCSCPAFAIPSALAALPVASVAFSLRFVRSTSQRRGRAVILLSAEGEGGESGPLQRGPGLRSRPSDPRARSRPHRRRFDRRRWLRRFELWLTVHELADVWSLRQPAQVPAFMIRRSPSPTSSSSEGVGLLASMSGRSDPGALAVSRRCSCSGCLILSACSGLCCVFWLGVSLSRLHRSARSGCGSVASRGLFSLSRSA